MVIRENCPQCHSESYKKNGRIHTGKQHHRCKDCGRQFVLSAEHRVIADPDRETIKRLLAERVSLRGICRVMWVSLSWLIDFAVQCYQAAPDDLNVRLPRQPEGVIVQRLDVEADEAWSFVGNKAHPHWLWIALDAHTRQGIAFHVGDRSRKSAQKRWKKIPAVYRENATFYTDGLASYHEVIPESQHRVITKKVRKTNHVERLNCTLRQRVSRLVRSALSFSKTLDNHIGAIKFFLSHYNLEVRAALPL
jgi:insertion element IS1 protein InsB